MTDLIVAIHIVHNGGDAACPLQGKGLNGPQGFGGAHVHGAGGPEGSILTIDKKSDTDHIRCWDVSDVGDGGHQHNLARLVGFIIDTIKGGVGQIDLVALKHMKFQLKTIIGFGSFRVAIGVVDNGYQPVPTGYSLPW